MPKPEDTSKRQSWYDFEWNVKHNTKLKLEHLQERMRDSGHLKQNIILDKKLFVKMMNKKIDNLNIEKAITEVQPFIKDNSVFDFWTKDYFRLLTDKVLF